MVYRYLHTFLVCSLSTLILVANLWLRIYVETFRELIRCAGWGVLPPEIDLDHLHDEYSRPCGETGKWIFEEAVFRRWRETEGSKLLWLCGGPGTGKTMLAKHVAAEFLRGPDDPPEGVKLAFHFVSPELPTTGISSDEAALSQLRLAKIASDLLYTILQQDGNLFDGCKAELEKQGDRFFTNPCSLWKVLRKAIKDCRTDPIYILIDGINGLKESVCKELIGRVLDLMKIRTVKIFLSSRNVPHISNNLPCNPYRCSKLDLDMNSFIKEDVESFIRYRVNAWGWDADIKEKAMKALLVKSGGIFLWASLAIDNLTYFSSGPDFDNFLRKPPLGLQEIYREMLSTLISRGESGEVLNMIWSVALALRPLTFGELSHILACIEEKTRSKQQPSGRETTGQIHLRTEREIKIYVRSSLGFLRTTAETVCIVHHTATEYLLDEYNKGNLPVLSQSEADLALSWKCFCYLHYVFGDPQRFSRGDVMGGRDGSRNSSLGGDRLEENRRVTPWEVACRNPQRAADQRIYLRYAAESWFIHARRSIEASGDTFCNSSAHDWLQHQFFETSDVIRRPWIELCGDSRMEALAGEQTVLNIAVCLGLMPLVEKALSDSVRGASSNRSPLHLAARFISGAYEILISQGRPSLLTDSDQDGNTPLHEAAISGHLSMLKALVKRFTRDTAYSNEINKKNHSGNTPLHLAFQFDHTEIVELLVKNGADTTIKNNAQITAFELGARLNRGDSLDILEHAEAVRRGTVRGVVEGSGIEPVEEPVRVRELVLEFGIEPVEEPVQVRQPVREPVREPVPESVREPRRGLGARLRTALRRIPKLELEINLEEMSGAVKKAVMKNPTKEPVGEPGGEPRRGLGARLRTGLRRIPKFELEISLEEMSGAIKKAVMKNPTKEPVGEPGQGLGARLRGGLQRIPKFDLQTSPSRQENTLDIRKHAEEMPGATKKEVIWDPAKGLVWKEVTKNPTQEVITKNPTKKEVIWDPTKGLVWKAVTKNPTKEPVGEPVEGKSGSPQVTSLPSQPIASRPSQPTASHPSRPTASRSSQPTASHSSLQMVSPSSWQRASPSSWQMVSPSGWQMVSPSSQQMAAPSSRAMASHSSRQISSHPSRPKVSVSNQPMISASGQSEVSVLNQPMILASGQSKVSMLNQPMILASGQAAVSVLNRPMISASGQSEVSVLNQPMISASGQSRVSVLNQPMISASGQSRVSVSISGSGQSRVSVSISGSGQSRVSVSC